MLIRPFAVADTEPVVALWEECGLVRPWNDPREDIARKLTVQPDLFLVGVSEAMGDAVGTSPIGVATTGPAAVGDAMIGSTGAAEVGPAPVAHPVIGTAMVGYDGHRGWINYVAVSPAHRGHGHGRMFMERAEQLLVALGCPKLNLQVRAGNDDVLAFYAALGYAPDHAISLGKRLIAD